MRALMSRELRRLAPISAGLLLLCCALLALDLKGMRPSGVNLSVVALLLAPALLGVAAVAPDTSAGGTAFLLRLPVRPAQVIVAKALCAGLLTLVSISPFLIGLLLYKDDDRGKFYVISLFGFAAGLLASVVAHRVMTALLVAPVLLAAVGILGVILPALALGISPGFAEVVTAAFSLAFGAAAVTSFARGERHRVSARPALIAAAILGPLVPLNLAANAGAQAWTYAEVLPGALRIKHATPAGARVAVAMHADLWTGQERRVAVLEGDRAWLVPARGAVWPEASPDGRYLLLRAGGAPGGWIVDLERRTTTAITGRASDGFGYTDAVWSSETGLVQLVRGRASVETFTPHPVDSPALGPETACAMRLMPGANYVGVTLDGRALLTDAEGVLSVPLPQPGQTHHVAPTRVLAFAADVSCQGAVASPSGRLLVVSQATDAGPASLRVLDLAAGTTVALAPDADGSALPARLDRGSARFSPDERRVALTLAGEHVASFDLRSGALLARHAAPANDAVRAWLGVPPFWSADGQALALPWGAVVFYAPHALAGGRCEDVVAHTHAGSPTNAVALVGERALLEGRPLALTPLFSREGASGAPELVVLEQGGAR